jgi:hypothetical protein
VGAGLTAVVWYVEGDFSLYEWIFGRPLVAHEALIPLYVAAGACLVLVPVVDMDRHERAVRRGQKSMNPAPSLPGLAAEAKARRDA